MSFGEHKGLPEGVCVVPQHENIRYVKTSRPFGGAVDESFLGIGPQVVGPQTYSNSFEGFAFQPNFVSDSDFGSDLGSDEETGSEDEEEYVDDSEEEVEIPSFPSAFCSFPPVCTSYSQHKIASDIENVIQFNVNVRVSQVQAMYLQEFTELRRRYGDVISKFSEKAKELDAMKKKWSRLQRIITPAQISALECR
jgi:hypothetical protein